MYLTLIISFLLLLTLIAFMSIGYIFNNKPLKGSCGNTDDNPCTCNLIERINCYKKTNPQ